MKSYIYDTSKGYSSLIKHYYSDKMNIETCTNKKRFLANSVSEFDVCFFVINDIEDFFNLLKIYFKVQYIFVVSPIAEFIEKIQNLGYKDLIILDSKNNKHDLLKVINFNLSSIELSKVS